MACRLDENAHRAARSATCTLTIAIACVFLIVAPAGAQQSVVITGDRLSGFVLPIEPLAAPIRLKALRAASWTVDDTKRLALSGDVRIEIGPHHFTAAEAVVWINRIGSEQGTINQIAVFFDRVEDPTKQPGMGVLGGELLVTASARGEVTLDVALMEEGEVDSPIVRRGERRLGEHLRQLAASAPPLANQPALEHPDEAPTFVPKPGGRLDDGLPRLPRRVELPPPAVPTPWIAGPQGVVHFSADKVEVASGQDENVITIIGSIVIDTTSDRRGAEAPPLILTAQRAVIFTDPSPLGDMRGELDAQAVRGIYLEGNVTAATRDGQYAVRAPRIYYDFRRQQAIMLESVLRIQPRQSRVAVYARAREMRQIAQNQWDARRVSVSTSEFYTPHLAIGADHMIVTQLPVESGAEGEAGSTEIYLDSRGNALQFSGVPIVPWPRFRGRIEEIPLKSVEVGTRRHDGVRILTTWDPFTLSGIEKPQGIDADLHVDGFTKRGGALGLDFDYDVGASEGKVELYGLYDEGVDRTSSGRDVEPDSEFRGLALLEHQSRFDQYWSLQAQASIISDETFMTAWREDDFLERREYETSLYLKHQRDNAALTLLAKYSLQDFLSNDYLLASRQYSVNKTPELTYRRYGDSLFGDHVTYSMENRLTRMQLAFQRTTPREIGVRGRAFGIDDDTPIHELLRAQGLRENWVNRFDSRHELSLPLTFGDGPLKATPFVVGRVTGYDDDFEEFSSDADEMRFFGAGGVRINTQFQRVHNSVESRLFDLHRMRHLVEPYVTLWAAQSNVSQEDLPIYDEEVESIADGAAVEFGVRNTWQTQRGGPGRWRSVDWLTLDTSVVLDSEGEPPQGGGESPTPQFFDYRPEYSQLGDHVHASAIWLLSDSLALTGETTYTLHDHEFARSSVGAELRHSPLLTTYVEYRVIEASDHELLAVNWTYQLTPKYRLSLSPQYDFREEDLRSMSARLTRSFPDFDFTLHVRYDQIRDDTTLGASVGLVEF